MTSDFGKFFLKLHLLFLLTEADIELILRIRTSSLYALHWFNFFENCGALIGDRGARLFNKDMGVNYD